MTMTTMTTTLASNVSQILHAALALDLTWSCDRAFAGGIVASRAVSVRTADQAVKLLHDAGYMVSHARDDEGMAWLYVSPDLVAVRAYVDAAGDLMVELPGQRGCVEVREATSLETSVSKDAADGWIEAHVARHLLVAVGYLPAEV
jgi:hypothetical protein